MTVAGASLTVRACGLEVVMSAARPRALDELAEACGGAARPVEETGPANGEAGARPSIPGRRLVVRVEASSAPFHREGLEQVCHGAWGAPGQGLLQDALGSGLDTRLHIDGETLTVRVRARRRARHRALALAASWRGVLLSRAATLQYPALWWAGVGGAGPLHGCAAQLGGLDIVLAGAAGAGKSTLLAQPGTTAVATDNLGVWDGRSLQGLPEPVRTATGTGRRMPHGRREAPRDAWVAAVAPDTLVLLRRGGVAAPTVESLSRTEALRELVAGTFAAGELRRYWPYAATLALATGLGSPDPLVGWAAADLLTRVDAVRCTIPDGPLTTPAQLATALRARALTW